MLKKLVIVVLILGLAVAGLLLATQNSRFVFRDSRELSYPMPQVWRALGETWAWSRWWPGLESAELSPALEPGAILTLTLKGKKQGEAVEMVTVTTARELAWKRTGFFGSETLTRFALQRADGGTEVTMETAVVGPLAVLVRIAGREDLAAYQDRLLTALTDYLARQPARGAAAATGS